MIFRQILRRNYGHRSRGVALVIKKEVIPLQGRVKPIASNIVSFKSSYPYCFISASSENLFKKIGRGRSRDQLV